MTPRNSGISVTDLFCGAGGSSLGAQDAGLDIRLAVNHWPLAIETHNSNFPHTDHDCADVSAVNPLRYRSTDILIASPECTNHSLAQGARRKNLAQRHLFDKAIDPSAERSRATMWDVPRFAEAHRYNIVIVENVVEATMWACWEAWLQAMHALGYTHKVVSLNSMFAHPTPQSRDRIYVVFWRKGNRAPELDLTPPAPCLHCGKDVAAVQTWKLNSKSGVANRVGRYRRQYVFTCPTCRREVSPYYYAALNALDLSVPGKRIGDKKPALKPRTLERIKAGLLKYGRQHLVITTNMTTDRGRVRSGEEPMFTLPGCNTTALVSPFLVETLFTQDPNRRAVGAAEPMRTQTGKQSIGVCMPMLVTAGSLSAPPRSSGEPSPTFTGSDRWALAGPGSYLVTLRGTGADQIPSTPVRGDEPIGTISAGGIHHALVTSGALITLRDHPTMQVFSADEALRTQAATAQTGVMSRAPYLIPYYGNGTAYGVDEPVHTLTTLDRHGLVDPGEELSVEDCYFRMLRRQEVGRGMAFPDSYKVIGNDREAVKQYGNAVTPPAMKWLIRQCVASLAPEMAA